MLCPTLMLQTFFSYHRLIVTVIPSEAASNKPITEVTNFIVCVAIIYNMEENLPKKFI